MKKYLNILNENVFIYFFIFSFFIHILIILNIFYKFNISNIPILENKNKLFYYNISLELMDTQEKINNKLKIKKLNKKLFKSQKIKEKKINHENRDEKKFKVRNRTEKINKKNYKEKYINNCKNPKILIYKKPLYPRLAKIQGISGFVSVTFNINNLGKTENLRIIASNPKNLFENNVIIAMNGWLYESGCEFKDLCIIFKFNYLENATNIN